MIARVMKREENLEREQNFSRMIARVMKRGDQGTKTMILRNICLCFIYFSLVSTHYKKDSNVFKKKIVLNLGSELIVLRYSHVGPALYHF